MYSITINAKTPADLASIAALLDGTNTAPEKTIRDFGLQEIVVYLEEKGFLVSEATPSEPQPLHELIAEDEAKAKKKAKSEKSVGVNKETPTLSEPPKTGDTVETAETATAGPGGPGGPGAENSAEGSPEELKDAAIKAIMGIYTKPEGKKVAGDLLKHFSIKNFHLVPEDRWAEFHTLTMKAIKAAGL